MNITRCYKILELKNGSSIDDARAAYKDMVRVWHPDRFASNPRLRVKANEKLKEINLAYSEIRKLWTKNGFSKRSNAGEIAHEENAHHVENTDLRSSKKILRSLYSRVFSLITIAKIRNFYRELMLSRRNMKEIPPEPSRRHGSKLHGTFVTKKDGRTKHGHFSEILQEVANAKKGKRKYADESNKSKPF